MENLESQKFIISISVPGKSWNLGERHGKSWKAICHLRIKKQNDQKSQKNNRRVCNRLPFQYKWTQAGILSIMMLENTTASI